jgi:hypothetical protein
MVPRALIAAASEVLCPGLALGLFFGCPFAPRVHCVKCGAIRLGMPLALSDTQLDLVMKATAPLDPSKRLVAMERVTAQLRIRGGHYISDDDVERAMRAALKGLVQGAA